MEGEEGDAVESKKGDRDTIELPEWQLSYLKAVHERGKPVVLVLTGGAAIAFPREIADAILFVWYPGEEGGNAVADVIFGDTNPSGHLPVTFPKSTSDLPAFEDYAMKGRTYRYATKEPLYPFGFGLSYTTWEFTSLKANLKDNGQTELSVELKNTGKTDGANAVQVYVSKKNRSENDPICSLRAFAHAEVKAGKSKTVSFTLPKTAFETITAEGESVIEKGEYIVTVADSSPSEISQKLGATKPASVTIKI